MVIQNYRNARGQARWRFTNSTVQRVSRTRAAMNCTPWAGPSTPWASRTSGPCASSSCSWATWAYAGGGVAAMRGESNVQGSTDHGLLFHIWPGYLGTPRGSNPTLQELHGEEDPQDQGSQEPQLAEEHAQVHRELPAVHVRHERHPGRGLQLSAQARRRRRLLLAHPLRPDVQGKVHRLLRLGHEPGGNRRPLQQGAPGPDQARLDGQRQPLRQRDGLFLERPRHGPHKDQDRGLHAALRLLHREGRQHLQQRPLDAVALQGRRTPWGCRFPTATSWPSSTSR